MGTSSQLPISSDTYKRTTSLLANVPEVVLDVGDKWKHKGKAGEEIKISKYDTYQRIYKAASNIDRKPEDGCMKKIKLERSLKLRKEDLRDKGFNVLTNNIEPEKNWLDTLSNQKEPYFNKCQPKIAIIHNVKD